MPAKQKIHLKKKKAYVSETEDESDEDYVQTQSSSEEEEASSTFKPSNKQKISKTRRTITRISNITRNLSKTQAIMNKKEKRTPNFLTIDDEYKISASNAKLLAIIVGNKMGVGRNEVTHRVKEYLRNEEEFKNLKLTVTALNSISLIMNHRFGSLFRIASILAALREKATVNQLDLKIAQAILDRTMTSVNSDPNTFIKMIKEYKKRNVINVNNQVADRVYNAITEAMDEDDPTQTTIMEAFKNPGTMQEIAKELKAYQKPLKLPKTPKH